MKKPNHQEAIRTYREATQQVGEILDTYDIDPEKISLTESRQSTRIAISAFPERLKRVGHDNRII